MSELEHSSRRPGRAMHLQRSGLKLRHLNLLVALDEACKVQDAAASLNLSQPAASKILADIERIVGTPLFERHPRGIVANSYGEVLIRRARTMLAELGQAETEITTLRNGEGGLVGVGAVMAPAADVLVDAIAAVRTRLPRVQISVRVETSDALVEALLASKLDFVLARIPRTIDPSPFHYREFGLEEGCLLTREDHPLARRRDVLPSELDDRDWVLQPRGSLLRHSLEAMLRRHGVAAPERVISTPSTLMTLMVMAKTNAISAFSQSVGELLVAGHGLAMLPLRERIIVEPYGLITLKNRPLSPAASVLRAEIEARLFVEPLASRAEAAEPASTPFGRARPNMERP
ncbi:MAG: LysR family transcriptional regulator [Geminicoccaceae bacterium]